MKRRYGPTHMCAPTKRRYRVGEKLHFSEGDWTVTGHEGLFYTKIVRADGEERTVSTMSIFHGLQEEFRNA